MFDLIFKNTNKFIDKSAQNYSRASEARLTNKTKIQTLLGLLYFTGILKPTPLNTDKLWATDGSSVTFFRLIMSRNRFRF